MARQGLCARPKRKMGLTGQNSSHTAPTDLLGRDFSAGGIDQKWCGDFKQVPTAERPVFLATVEGLYSRRMVGFAVSLRDRNGPPIEYEQNHTPDPHKQTLHD